MPNPTQPRRARCERCQRPASHCLCAHIPSVSNRTRVLVLQHPDEARLPLNTARLAVLGLQHAELWVGEYFHQLEAAVAAARRAMLLFPAPEGGPPASAPSPAPDREDATDLLIVPDGTWRKARGIVGANPVLATLP